MEVTYAAPDAVSPNLRRLVLTVGADSVHRLSRTLPSSETGGYGLLRAVTDQFSARFHIQLSAFRLVRIGTQIAFIATEGKAKVRV